MSVRRNSSRVLIGNAIPESIDDFRYDQNPKVKCGHTAPVTLKVGVQC